MTPGINHQLPRPLWPPALDASQGKAVVWHFRDSSHSPGGVAIAQPAMSNSAKVGKARGGPEPTYSLEVFLRPRAPDTLHRGRMTCCTPRKSYCQTANMMSTEIFLISSCALAVGTQSLYYQAYIYP